MSTMNTNHMFDCDQLLPIGESMLEHPSMSAWGDDIGKELENADFTSANVNIWEPSKELASSFMPETHLHTMETYDLTLLDFDLTTLLSLPESGVQPLNSSNSHESLDLTTLSPVPDSPCSEDSGVWSPGSSNSPESPQDLLSNLCESEDFKVNLVQNDLQSHISTDLELPLELPISVTDTAELHSLGPFVNATVDSCTFDSSKIQISAVDILTPVQECKKPIAPRKARSSKTKSLTPHEKRERKKEQNKNAATRYREKKRAEGESVMRIQIGLEDKNKELKDKVSQVTREIQYLKELLIEVYRTKGIIE